MVTSWNVWGKPLKMIWKSTLNMDKAVRSLREHAHVSCTLRKTQTPFWKEEWCWKWISGHDKHMPPRQWKANDSEALLRFLQLSFNIFLWDRHHNSALWVSCFTVQQASTPVFNGISNLRLFFMPVMDFVRETSIIRYIMVENGGLPRWAQAQLWTAGSLWDQTYRHTGLGY